MDPLVFSIVLLAAVLHAAWNALVKNAGDKYFSMTAIVLGHAPLAVLALPFVPLPDPESWPFGFATMTTAKANRKREKGRMILYPLDR